VGVLVRFATVALGNDPPFLRSSQPSRIIQRTLSCDPRVGFGFEHTALNCPSLETGAGASDKHPSFEPCTILSPLAAEHSSRQTLCPPNPSPLDVLDIVVPTNAMPSDHPQTPQSPSTASFSAADLPRKQSTSPRISHSLPTPAHSINDSMSSTSDTTLEAAMLHDALHEEVSNKRKRDVEDNGDRDQKKVHVEDSRASIDDLHLDVGEKYLLCRTRKAPSSTRSSIFPLVLYSRSCTTRVPCTSSTEVFG
jgi:hypothetical protein